MNFLTCKDFFVLCSPAAWALAIDLARSDTVLRFKSGQRTSTRVPIPESKYRYGTRDALLNRSDTRNLLNLYLFVRVAGMRL